MSEANEKKGRWGRRLLIAAAALLLVIAALALAIPVAILYAPLPNVNVDVSRYLKGKTAALFDSHRVTARLKVRRGERGGFRIRADGRLLDWPFSATANVRFGFIRAEGDVSAELDGTGLRLVANFDARSAKDWRFAALMPDVRLSSEDAVLGRILSRLELASVTNLTCSGEMTLSVEGECTPKRPVPAWSLEGSVKDAAAEMCVGSTAVKVNNLRFRFGAKGLADRREISPMFPRADSVEAAGVMMTNVFASIRATDRAYLITEAGAECAGGELKLYALFLDTVKLSTGATIYVDGVDAGYVLKRIKGFSGEATGRLHGKLPFYLRDGKTLRFKDAYLFSTPGETGKVRIADATPILDNLALGGVTEDDRKNLAKALADLDYTVLKVQLRRGEGGDDSSLSMKLEGSATHGKTTVPVRLDVTFRGDQDLLIDTGMKLKRR